jgi:hypothetical protein
MGNLLKGHLATGALLIGLAGLGVIGYGIASLISTFTSFIELGLSPEQLLATPAEIVYFSPELYDYIVHLQVALSGFMIAFGAAIVALAWFGIRSRQSWALWTACVVTLLALAIALPLHFSYGFATLEHVGPGYVVIALILVGTALSYPEMKSGRLTP